VISTHCELLELFRAAPCIAIRHLKILAALAGGMAVVVPAAGGSTAASLVGGGGRGEDVSTIWICEVFSVVGMGISEDELAGDAGGRAGLAFASDKLTVRENGDTFAMITEVDEDEDELRVRVLEDTVCLISE
jgi:hypothetical protein